MLAKKSIREMHARVSAEAQPWLDDLTARNRAPGTIIHARNALVKLLRFLDAQGGPTRLRDVRASDLEAWMTSMFRAKQKMNSIRNAVEPVQRFYRWREKRGLIFENPAQNVEMPRFARPMQPVPTEAEIGGLLIGIPMRAVLDLRDRALLETAYAAGLRLAELAGLNIESVDLAHGSVRTIGKGSRERVMPLTRAAVDAIRLYLEKARPVLLRGHESEPALWLTHKGGRRIGHIGLHDIVKCRAEVIGVEMSMHSIRRAFATHLLHHGASPMDLKLFLGHVTFKHLKHYLRYAPVELMKIHQRSRLGR